jgi:trehalose 6-phosphate phosphatase
MVRAMPTPLYDLAADAAHSALFLDFDGTLSTIVDDPVGARPLPGVPALLAELAVLFALVAVISGRPTAFLRDVLDAPPGVELVGLYGLERALGTSGDAGKWAAVIDAVVAEARAGAPTGVYVEPKGLTVTLHWRHAPEARGWVEAFVTRVASTHGLAVHSGRMELELRPPLHVDKGTVVHQLADELGGRLRQVGVFGDDLGDLPAFEAVGRLGTPATPVGAVRVAAVDAESPAAVAERADLTVPGAAGAAALLRDLAGALAGARGEAGETGAAGQTGETGEANELRG